MYLADSAAMLTRREASTPRLCLGVLASLLINIALKLHSEESKYLLSSSCNFSSSTPRPSSSTPRLRLGVLELGLSVLERSRWWAPPATSAQVRFVQVQVHLGYASVYLNLDSAYLSGVSQVHHPPLSYLYQSSKQVKDIC